MMRLRWVRTILTAIGFVWLMVQWHLTIRLAHANEVRLAELIAINCAREAQPSECELGLRLRASAVEVRGMVDMSGSVDVQ